MLCLNPPTSVSANLIIELIQIITFHLPSHLRDLVRRKNIMIYILRYRCGTIREQTQSEGSDGKDVTIHLDTPAVIEERKGRSEFRKQEIE